MEAFFLLIVLVVLGLPLLLLWKIFSGIRDVRDRLDVIDERLNWVQDQTARKTPASSSEAGSAVDSDSAQPTVAPVEPRIPVRLLEPLPPLEPQSFYESVQASKADALAEERPMDEADVAVDDEPDDYKSAAREYEPPRSNPLTEARIGQRGLLVVGIIILVLGIGYFLQYSFQQGWVSPWLRVAMTFFAGVGLLAGGEGFRRKGYDAFGMTLAGGGVATLYFATFAGHGLYGLMGSLPAFMLMIMVTALAGTLAVIYDNRWLALLGLVGGFVTPLLISTEQPSAVSLFSYLMVLNCGVLGIAYFRRWTLLNYCGMTATWLVFSLWFGRYYSLEHAWTALIFSGLFFITYAIAPTLYFIQRRTDNEIAGLSSGIPNALIGLGFGIYIMQHKFGLASAGLLTLGYGFMFASVAALLQRKRPEAEAGFAVNLIQAMVLLGLTIPVVMSGPWISFFWALLAVALGWGSHRLNNFWIYRGALLVGLLAVAKLLLYDYQEEFGFQDWHRGFRDPWSEDALVRALLIIAVAVFPFILARFSTVLAQQGRAVKKFLYVVCGIHLFLSLNLEVRGFFLSYAPGAADAATSVLWTLFSIALLGLGFRKRLQVLRTTAIVLFAATILKVLLVDMAETATPYRILSSIILGLILIGSSFLYYHFKDALESEKK